MPTSGLGTINIINNIGRNSSGISVINGKGQVEGAKAIYFLNNTFTHESEQPGFSVHRIPRYLLIKDNVLVGNGLDHKSPTSVISLNVIGGDTTGTIVIRDNTLKFIALNTIYYSYLINLFTNPVRSIVIEDNELIGTWRAIYIQPEVDTLVIRNNSFSKKLINSPTYVHWSATNDFIDVSNNMGDFN